MVAWCWWQSCPQGVHLILQQIFQCLRRAGNEWSKGCQLNFVNPLHIRAPIDSFMMGITGRDEKPLVGCCLWVKYRKCMLVRVSQNHLACIYVCPGTFVISDCGCRVGVACNLHLINVVMLRDVM